MENIEVKFYGNGHSTDNIERAIERLCEDLNGLGGKPDRSYWNLSIGAGPELIAKGEQIVNDAKSLMSLIKGYCHL